MFLYQDNVMVEETGKGEIYKSPAISLFPRQKCVFLSCITKNFTNGHKNNSISKPTCNSNRNQVYHVRFFFY